MKPSIAFTCTLTACIAACPTHAVTLPPGYQIQAPSPTVSVSVSNSGTIVGNTPTQVPPQAIIVHMAGPRSVSGTAAPGAAVPGAAAADASASLGPSPNIAAHAFASATGVVPAGTQQVPFLGYGYNAASAGAQLYYFMAISGPTPTVNVNIQATLGVSSAPHLADGDATASFYVHKSNGTSILDDLSSFSTGNPYAGVNVVGNAASGYTGNVTENSVHSFETGQVYVIGLLVRATATAAGGSGGLGGDQETHAFVDPLFSIAPGTAGASAYSFVFSQGIVNAPVVPEPPAWALLLSGLAWTLTSMRRSRFAGTVDNPIA